MQGTLAVADDLDETLARARAGDPAAFASLLRTHQAMVFSLALHALRSRSVAEDVAQDVFVELYRSLARIDSAAHVAAWLRRVTCHRCIDELRRPRRRLELATGTVPDRAGPARAPEPFLEARLRELVAALPPLPRMVVVLRYQEDLGPSEIADELKMSINTVKSHLRRSIETLRRELVRLTPDATDERTLRTKDEP